MFVEKFVELDVAAEAHEFFYLFFLGLLYLRLFKFIAIVHLTEQPELLSGFISCIHKVVSQFCI